MKWHRLARHRWVANASITESVDEDGTARRFTATICGYLNWKIAEGDVSPILVMRLVRAIRDQIERMGEGAPALVAGNEYSRSNADLKRRIAAVKRSSRG